MYTYDRTTFYSYDRRREAALRVAGIFEAPPAMYEEIYDWVVAVVSDHELKKAQSLLKGRKEKTDYDKRLSQLLDVAKEYKTNPTWKNYKAFYDVSWVFGHPGERDSIRLFQKMTPEKQKDLQERADNRYEYYKGRVDGHYESKRQDIADIQREIASIKKRIQPGVTLKGDEAVREFPINLKGWRYDTKDLEKKLQKQIDEHVEELKGTVKFLGEKDESAKPEVAEMRKQLLEDLKKSIERTKLGWQGIKVKLTTKATKGVKAFWYDPQRLLTIIIPDTLRWEGLEGLGKSLRHELQHFAQSYMAYAVDRSTLMLPEMRGRRPGFPSRKIQTPEFRQQYDPGHPSYRKDDPEVIKLRQRLKDQGLSVRQLDFHALDDIEFYTRLADSIDSFEWHWKQAQKEHRDQLKERKRDGEALPAPLELRSAVKLFTGTIPFPDYRDRDWQEKADALGGYRAIDMLKPHEFFKALKRSAPGKYRKALSEFVKAVT